MLFLVSPVKLPLEFPDPNITSGVTSPVPFIIPALAAVGTPRARVAVIRPNFIFSLL